MINQILDAMKISLAECMKYEDPAEYIYQINQVLNRYKSNIYKAIGKQTGWRYDNKEFINFRIMTSWTTRPMYTGDPVISQRSPIMLYCNGFTPTTERVNKEDAFNTAVDISDVVSLDRIASIRNDYHTRPAMSAIKDYKSEVQMVSDKHDDSEDTLSLIFTAEAGANDNYVFNLQLNSVVYKAITDVEYIQQAKNIVSHPSLSLKEIAAREKAGSPVPKEALLPVRGKRKTGIVENFFG